MSACSGHGQGLLRIAVGRCIRVDPPSEGHSIYHGALTCARAYMEQDGNDSGERCVNERCWSGPMLVIGTEKGSIGDARTAIMVLLSKFYDEATTRAMMSCFDLVSYDEEKALLGFAIGRDPRATVLREIFARVKVYLDGELVTHSAQYRVAIEGEGERERCDALVSHYRWLEGIRLMANK